jgi:hypothetical protein
MRGLLAHRSVKLLTKARDWMPIDVAWIRGYVAEDMLDSFSSRSVSSLDEILHEESTLN